MSSFTFTNPINGQQIELSGDTLTEAQAREIFNQQLEAGSLVGLKPGDYKVQVKLHDSVTANIVVNVVAG